MRRIALAAGLFLASIFVLPAQAAPPEESFESLLRRLEATERRRWLTGAAVLGGLGWLALRARGRGS